MSKAFDNVLRNFLLSALMMLGLPLNELKLIADQYNECQITSKLSGVKSRPIIHNKGIKQGCTLSGMIWNLIMVQVHNKFD